jgi:hypothetical protein
MKEPSQADGRQAYSAIDPTNKFLALSDNSYLAIFIVKPMEKHELYY